MLRLYQIFQALVLNILLLMFISSSNSTATISNSFNGSVQYQGRLTHSGITIRLHDDPLFLTATTPNGHFTLIGLSEGTYWLRIEAPLYLANLIEITVTDTTTSVPTSLLLGGDLNKDDQISIADAALIGVNFGSGTPEADINADGIVNIQDLAIVGGNLGKSTPSNPSPNDNSENIYLPIIFHK